MTKLGCISTRSITNLTCEISSVTPTETGFTIEFDQEIDPSELNLYDTASADRGPADVVLRGAATGEVIGSLIVDRSLRSVQFVKTDAPLVPDEYMIEIRSGLDAFKSAAGQILNGNGDDTNADDFITTFTVPEADAGSRVISIPDFVRGPGQTPQLPADSAAGIPLTISDAAGVERVDLRISYDPTLLLLSGATVGPSMPAGTSVSTDGSVAGEMIVSFVSPNPLAAGSQVLVHLQSLVVIPETSEDYGRQHVLDIHSTTIAGSDAPQIPVVSDDAVHLAAYFGDVTGDRRINASDASRVARVAAQLDGGFQRELAGRPTCDRRRRR